MSVWQKAGTKRLTGWRPASPSQPETAAAAAAWRHSNDRMHATGIGIGRPTRVQACVGMNPEPTLVMASLCSRARSLSVTSPQ